MIFHVDVNSAYLSWESVRRVKNGLSDLRLVPAIIGGEPQSRISVVLTKSIPAKKYGIITGEPVSSAMRKCPGLVVEKPDFQLYVKYSRAFKDICRQYAPVVEEFSIDECFLDMTGTSRIYPDPIATAGEIKDRIRDNLGFTVNVGVAANKLLAKMASDFEKPDKVHTLFPAEIPVKMWPLPVGDLFLCGKSSADRLQREGICTIGDLAHANPDYVQKILGQKTGTLLYRYANGIDNSPVCAEPDAPKGYSNERTFEEDVTSYETAERILLFLSDKVAGRIRKDGVKAACVSVTVRGSDRKKHSHQMILAQATDITNEVYQAAVILLRELWDGKKPLRLIGLSLTGLDDGSYQQFSLMDQNEKRIREQKADKVMDDIRSRFGRDMVRRGSLINNDIRKLR